MAITDYLPADLGLPNISIPLIVTVIAVIILVGTIVGIATWFIVINFRFNRKIIIFQDVNGKPEIVRRDRAAQLSLQGTGDTIFYLRKSKKYLPTPQIQTGRNTYWFFIREDGEWLNIGLGDLNEQFRQVGARFLDTEMRYARASLLKTIKDRYDKEGFWKQYGVLIVNIAAIVIIMVFLWLIVKELIDLAATVKGAVDTAKEVLAETRKVLGALDNIKGGSGLQ